MALAILIVHFWMLMHTVLSNDCGHNLISHYRQPRKTFSFSEGRIINGKKSIRGAWPWQVSLQLLHPKFGLIGHWCGGVLIQSRWILTAAHCINNDMFNLPVAALWTAVLGEWNRDVDEDNELHVPIDRIIIHEKFNNYQNDLALMKLGRRVNFQSICLPNDISSQDLFPEIMSSTEMNIPRHPSRRKPKRPGKKAMECVATGWGHFAPNGPMVSILLQAKVPLLDNSVCNKTYGLNIPIKMGHLCAGKLDGSTGTCIGDSGGPLQCMSREGRWFLAGITSFGSGCAKPGYPDVYTRLAFYIPWIKSKIEEDKEHEENYLND